MASWVVVPCLDALRDEFNKLNPNRDKASDGSIGDSNHTSSSDHTPDEDSRVLRDHDADSKNEVHARDIDKTGPWPGGETFHQIVMRILDGERKKWRDPNDKCRLSYVIWAGKIYDKDNDFQPETYGGLNGHYEHGHFSARYETSCENDTRPWGVVREVIVATQFNQEDKDVIKAQAKDGVDDLTTLVAFTTGGGVGSNVGNSVWGHGYPKEDGAPRTPAWTNLRDMQADVTQIKADAAAAKDNAAAANLAAVDAARAVSFLEDDFPGIDPESDPIVKRIRYVMDNPSTPA
ncbi:MAG: hypothetical protein ABW022_11100 [Actinoplanes sp.]